MFLIINIINLLLNNSIKLTGLDYIIIALGGYDINNIDFMTIIIAIYPYILIAMLIERYISDFIEKKEMWILIRVNNKKIYYIGHIITIGIFILLLIFIYDLMLFGCSINFGNLNKIGEQVTKNIDNLVDIYAIKRILINIFLVQVLGVFTMSMLQVLILKYTKKVLNGILVVITIYILNIYIPKIKSIGTFILINKINVISYNGNGQSVNAFIIQNILVSFILIFLILKIDKNSMFF